MKRKVKILHFWVSRLAVITFFKFSCNEKLCKSSKNHFTKKKKNRSKELNAAFDNMESSLNSQLKAKLLVLLGQKNEILKESNLLESVVHEVFFLYYVSCIFLPDFPFSFFFCILLVIFLISLNVCFVSFFSCVVFISFSVI